MGDNQWISVEKEYPVLAEGVLVSDGVVVGWALWHRELSKWVKVEFPWENFNLEVSHWMPLPPIPKE